MNTEIKWDKNGRQIEEYNEISGFLYTKDGVNAIRNISKRCLNGDFSPFESPYNKQMDWLNMLLFSKAFENGFVEGFKMGFREGGKSMEIELSNCLRK